MERYLRTLFNTGLGPNRAQHLVVSDSKHLFFYEKDQVIRYQKKDLDPRTSGAREMVTRVIAIDEDTGVLYGELWPRDDHLDLLGFLARAWARKADHPMRGFPGVIYAPSRVFADKRLAGELAWCASIGEADVRQAPSGFGPATVAAREYERHLLQCGAGAGKFVLRAAHMGAQQISVLACVNAVSTFSARWAGVAGPPAEALEKFDAAYEEKGGWRLDDFAPFIVANGT